MQIHNYFYKKIKTFFLEIHCRKKKEKNVFTQHAFNISK